ncbi:MAG: hypothetical protein GTN80_04350 [Nitrososphaeria archaeon]|nr:hypothetical protein [Nitrososphaeria archaeon]NIN52371.1 hypothetical protein [Nitrososphaeria archaeon]NIQ32859.1 hypothetical protein [Nitrososphaeria archaeon]
MAEVIFEGRLNKITKTKMKFQDIDGLAYELPYTDDALIQISKLKKQEESEDMFIDTYIITTVDRQITKVELGKKGERTKALDIDKIKKIFGV